MPLVVSVDGEPLASLAGHPEGLLRVVLPLTGTRCGDHSLTVTPRQGRAVSARFTITCPVLTPGVSGLDDRQLPPSVAFTGSGFDPDTVVRLGLPGAPVATLRTGTDGTLTGELPTADLPCGVLRARATEQVPLAVPPSATAPLPLRCTPYTPAVEVAPLVGTSGEVVDVRGRGFHPGSRVSVTWVLDGGGTGLGSAAAVTDAAGAFRTSMLLFGHDRTGPRRAHAVDAEGATAEGPLLVVSGTVQPGRHQVAVEGRRGLLNRR